MKLFKILSQSTALAVIFPLLLIVPNVALCFTESMPLWASLANVVLPLGVYQLLMTVSRRTGRAVLCCLPLMVLAAFQIVLLYLYGESIIAVDMFLNVVTTNTREVSELLGNLLGAIATVVVLYLPMIVWGAILCYRHQRLDGVFLKRYRRAATGVTVVGAVMLLISHLAVPRFSVDEDIFPVNVMCNLVTAVEREVAVMEYPETSADFSFGCKSSPRHAAPEVHILVIGETSRADNWQLFGYDRETNPQLSAMPRLVAFPKALTQSNTTHKSVPMLMSDLTAANFDSIAYRKGIITAFKEAGYATAYYSNQRRNGSYIDYFGTEADKAVFLKDDGREHYDAELVDMVERELADTAVGRRFIVLHTYGSHFNYRDRYEPQYSYFTPDHTVDAGRKHKAELVNAFDNTIRYIDSYLARLMEAVESRGYSAVVTYASDHGEDIFDDDRGRFLHASPVPTATQLHVPMLVWVSSAYDSAFPEKRLALQSNSGRYVTPSASLFHTVADMASLSFSRLDHSLALSSTSYGEPEKRYLTDRNEMVPLLESGLKSQDVERLEFIGVL